MIPHFWTKMGIATFIGILLSIKILSLSAQRDKEWTEQHIPNAQWTSGEPHGWSIFWSVVIVIVCELIAYYLIP